MNYDPQLLDNIYDMYITSQIGFNDICNKCREHSNKKNFPLKFGPVPIFHVGKDYGKQEKKLLFIGKVAYGWGEYGLYERWGSAITGDQESKEYLKNTIEERVKELFINPINKYFKYLNNSLSEIYGSAQEAYDRIAITNFVHCNDGRVMDFLSQKTRDNCASKTKNGFIHKEIEILKPTHVFVLTKSLKKEYERYIRNEKLNIKILKHPSGGISQKEFKEKILSSL